VAHRRTEEQKPPLKRLMSIPAWGKLVSYCLKWEPLPARRLWLERCEEDLDANCVTGIPW